MVTVFISDWVVIIQVNSMLSVNHISHLKLSYSVFRVRSLRLSQCRIEMK